MPTVVEVPGVGEVEFPDSMSVEEINAQIKRIPPRQTTAMAPATPSVTSNPAAAQSSNWLGTAAKTLWDRINPVEQVRGVAGAIAHPIDTLKGIGTAQDALRLRAVDEYRKGNYGEAFRSAVNYLMPILGPESQRIGDVANEKGATSPEFAGEMVGLGANLAAPSAVGKIKNVRLTPRLSVPAKEAAALDYLAEKGVPVSAGVRSGNRFIRGVEELVDTSPVGALQVQPAIQEATGQALRRTADELAARTGARPLSPQQAGQGIRRTLENKISRLDEQADKAYTAFRAIESDPKNLRAVRVGQATAPEAMRQLDSLANSLAQKPFAQLSQTEQAAIIQTANRLGIDATPRPVLKQIAMPVDVRPIKEMLRPIHEDMTTWWEPARRSSSQGYQAVKSILEGEDFVQASVAEKGLGGLKELAREARTAATRNVNQGTAAFIVKHLQDAIDSSVASQGGGKALAELRRGRRLTASKYGVDEIVRQLREEPVQAFQQAVYRKDSGIKLLSQVAKEAPQELKNIGRAWLDDVFNTASEASDVGLVEHGQGLWKQWQNLGKQSKHMLFSPSHVADLDKFFLGVKKLAESPNPSKTAILQMIQGHSAGTVMGLINHPARASLYIIGTGKLSKLLHSPRGVRALTKGVTVPLGNKIAATAAASEILKLAGEDAKPYVLPKAAEDVPLGAPEWSLAAAQ